MNNPDLFIEAGLPADSFYFESDALTKLACLSIDHDSAIGTIYLLHNENNNRDSLLSLTQLLFNRGYSIILYDQRASGRSSGKYHSNGSDEATDLMEMISTMEIREQIIHPLYVVGFSIGGDASLLAALEENRISGLIAINPYLTTKRFLDLKREQFDTYWFPFYRTIMWWWYKMRSGNTPPYREIEDIKPVACQTLLIVNQQLNESDEIKRLLEISDNDKLKIEMHPTHPDELNNLIVSYFNNL